MLVRLERLDEFARTLAAPFANARSSWAERKGLLIGLRGEDGRVGLGEASPLPGYSPDSLAEARAALEAFGRRGDLSLDWQGDWGARVDSLLESIPLQIPSARFAVETALLDLVGQALGLPLHRLMGTAPGRVAWAGVIEASGRSGALERARTLIDSGVHTLKVKVDGGAGWPEAISFLRALRELAGSSVRIRIDANRTMSADELRDRLDSLSSVQPEFVEEPGDPDAVARLSSVPVALALDESLHGGDAEARIAALAGARSRAREYRFVVLKPTVLGGARRCLHLARAARSAGAGVVVSHTLEGPVAWTACAALALAVDDGRTAAGLEPHHALGLGRGVRLPNLDGAWIVPHERPGLGLGAWEVP